MFTPQEVSEKTFPKSPSFSSGYDLAAVDEFLDTLTEDYTALYKENAALKTKLKILAEKVEEYRATEDTMRSMLLAAQKMAASMTEEAKEKGEKTLADARQESERLLTDARNAADELNRDLARKTEAARQKLSDAETAMKDYIAKSLAMCLDQVDYLEKLPHSELPAAPAPAQEPADQEPAAEAAPEQPAEGEVPQETAPEENPAREPVPSQDTAQLIEKDILAAYDEEKPAQPLPADTDFRSEFKLDLDELKFGRNYEPDK
ncbi:MAG: DivIVA domain-containing protein [Oscillospiraceae bacterium]